jgi:hypothetical protein
MGVHGETKPDPQRSFLQEEIEDERLESRRLLLRWTVAFVLLFGLVFLAFWWSGSAIRFGAARVAAANSPTYRVWGTVRDAKSGQPIPWAAIEDDAAGNPPFFHTDADAAGSYSLLTLAEPHQVRISASGYRPLTARVGRPWFVWWPRGSERCDVRLTPETSP